MFNFIYPSLWYVNCIPYIIRSVVQTIYGIFNSQKFSFYLHIAWLTFISLPLSHSLCDCNSKIFARYIIFLFLTLNDAIDHKIISMIFGVEYFHFHQHRMHSQNRTIDAWNLTNWTGTKYTNVAHENQNAPTFYIHHNMELSLMLRWNYAELLTISTKWVRFWM